MTSSIYLSQKWRKFQIENCEAGSMKTPKVNTEQPMLEFRKKVVTSIINGAEISSDRLFEELLEVLYGGTMCGLDFVDVYQAVKGRTAKICCIEEDNLESIKSRIVKELDYNSKAVIAAIKLPTEHGLDTVHEIAETLTISLNEDAGILWQAGNYSRKTIKMVILLSS